MAERLLLMRRSQRRKNRRARDGITRGALRDIGGGNVPSLPQSCNKTRNGE
jgi:hypothetical protein